MSEVLKIPELLDGPEKLKPIIDKLDDYRYFLPEGGRGGGKSQFLARFLLYLGERYNLRVVCGREIQKNITESVHSLMADIIRHYKLNYEIFATKIVHRTSGTQINFRGFREQGAFNIQGMEGVDILWIDEAQAVTKQTLDVLIPTIRKDNAKIFFSMNRHVADDPVFEQFALRDDCLHIHLNFFDNKFCTKALEKEAEECKKKDTDDYNHIWLGIPLDKSEDAVFTYSSLQESKINKKALVNGYGYRIAGFDIARFGDDTSACVIIQQMGALHWEEVFSDEWGQKDLNYTTGRILAIINEQRVDRSIIDEDGIGSGPLDTLQKGRGMDSIVGFRNPAIAYKDNKDYANNRTKNAYRLRDMFMNGHMAMNTDKLIKELTTIKYTYDHQQRKILISKKLMRDKFKIKSPNLADGLIMAVSLVDEEKFKQDVQYFKHNTQAPEENLFNLAGVK